MGILHRIDSDTSTLYERWEGLITADILSEYWAWCAVDPGALACERELVDVRPAEFGFSGTELRILVEKYIVGLNDKVDFQLAILVGQPVQVGVTRQYQVFTETFGDSHIFTEEAGALEWLGLPQEPGIPTEGFVSHRDRERDRQ